MKTKQEVINFLESKVGTKVPCVGNSSLDGQCVTLIKALMEFLGVPNPYKARGHGKDCINNYLKEGIADPGPGLISVFSNKDMAVGYGHVWCNAGDGAGTYYESNGSKPLIVTKGQNYSYDNVCNFDKYIKEEETDMSRDAELSRDHYWNTLKEISMYLNTEISVENDVDKLPAMVWDLSEKLKDCQSNDKQEFIELEDKIMVAGKEWVLNGVEIVDGKPRGNYKVVELSAKKA